MSMEHIIVSHFASINTKQHTPFTLSVILNKTELLQNTMDFYGIYVSLVRYLIEVTEVYLNLNFSVIQYTVMTLYRAMQDNLAFSTFFSKYALRIDLEMFFITLQFLMWMTIYHMYNPWMNINQMWVKKCENFSFSNLLFLIWFRLMKHNILNTKQWWLI